MRCILPGEASVPEATSPAGCYLPWYLWLLQEVGYRQGLNWVVAVLLMFLHEEDAFWALTQLMMKPRYAMHGRWPGGMGALKTRHYMASLFKTVAL